MLDCLFIGSTTQDILLLVKESPASDKRIAAIDIVTTCGGPGSTAAVAFQSLAGRAGLITALGDDEQGVFIKHDLLDKNFDYLKIHTIKGYRSSFSTIQVEQNGRRCITCFGGCMDGMKPDVLDTTVLKNTKMIHLGGLSDDFLVHAVKICKENSDALISVDGGNYDLKTTNAILPYVDVFIPDDKTVAKTLDLEPKDACRYYYKHGAKIACITLGNDGSLAYDGNRFYYAPTIEVNVKDTTGAGDNFHGAFMYCLLQGLH